MSRRRASYDDGLGRGRQAAADQLLSQLVGSEPAARDWTQSPTLPGRRDRGIEELIEARGGVAGLARDLGVARTTVQGWRNRGVTPRGASRDKLGQLNDQLNAAERRAAAQKEFGELANRYGGTKGLAATVGVNPSTASRWLSGKSAPSLGNLEALKRADNRWRIAKTQGITLGPDGRPAKRMHFKTTGEAKVIGRSGSPEDDRGSRTWGEASQGMGQPGIAFTDANGEFGGFWDAAAAGDALGALDAFQAYMSNEVTNCSGYDPENGIGVFFENFENFDLIEDPLDDFDEDLYGDLA